MQVYSHSEKAYMDTGDNILTVRCSNNNVYSLVHNPKEGQSFEVNQSHKMVH